LNFKIIAIIYFVIVSFLCSTFTGMGTVYAQTPRGKHVTDLNILKILDLSAPDYDPVWCYNSEANSVLISKPNQVRQECEITLQNELTKQKVRHDFQIDTLKIELDSLKIKSQSVISIKEKQIEELTEAALNSSNNNYLWWASGGFILGATSVIGIFLIVK
tara:strand:+ start:16121 stop:16603 length:483 start_codon:yes stop_codon:yes gene_type:complete